MKKRKADRRRKRTEKKLARDRRREQRSRPKFNGDLGGTIIPNGFSTPLMKNFTVENPFYGLTDEQLCEVARSFGTDAAKRFRADIDELISAVKNHNPVELLATAAFYCLFRGVGPDTDYTKDDPYPQSTVELLQSICLRHPEDQFCSMPMLHQHLFRLLDLSTECSKNFSRQRISGLADVDPSARKVLMSIEEARSQTQFVRNWGHPQHVRQIIRELLEPLEAEIASCIGLGPIAFLELTDALSRQSCERAFDFMRTIGDAFRATSLRKMVTAFCQLVGSPDEDAKKIFELMNSRPGSKKAKRSFLVSYFHQRLPDIFTFTLNDCEKLGTAVTDQPRLRTILDDLSYEFGALQAENPEHLVMQSKIRSRPIIKIGPETYFLPVFGLIHGFFLDIIESWIKPNPGLRQRYHKRRAAYLEASIERMLGDAFPDCVVQTGTIWTDPENLKEYENDCLVVCGPLALVFEAKSERVDDVARRGGIKTLKDHYETLVSEPAEQAARLARLLEDGCGTRRFQTKAHGEYELDLSGIRRAVCISVTLDWFPAASLCWQKLVASGLIAANKRPAINMSLADLLVVFQVLDSPAKRLHYFWRRIEWESRVEYLADEEDLLVYYLSEGLAIPRVQDGEVRPQLMLYGNSEHLRRYYMAEWVEANDLPPLPKRILTPWWSSIIDRIATLKLPHRWDIACVLLDLSFERQREFKQRLEGVVRTVRRDGNTHGMDGVVTYADHTESLGAVVGFVYRNLTMQERNGRAADLARKARAQAGAQRVVVIGRDVDSRGGPYDFLAFIDGENCQ